MKPQRLLLGLKTITDRRSEKNVAVVQCRFLNIIVGGASIQDEVLIWGVESRCQFMINVKMIGLPRQFDYLHHPVWRKRLPWRVPYHLSSLWTSQARTRLATWFSKDQCTTTTIYLIITHWVFLAGAQYYCCWCMAFPPLADKEYRFRIVKDERAHNQVILIREPQLFIGWNRENAMLCTWKRPRLTQYGSMLTVNGRWFYSIYWWLHYIINPWWIQRRKQRQYFVLVQISLFVISPSVEQGRRRK